MKHIIFVISYSTYPH